MPITSSLLGKNYDRALRAALAALAFALPLSIAGANAALALLTVLLIYGAAARRDLAWNSLRSPAVAALAVYLAAAGLAIAFSMNPALSLRSFPKDLHKLWALGLFLVALRSVERRRLIPWLAGGFVLAALVGICQSLFLRNSEGFWIRAHAFVHPVTFGTQLALAMLGVICLYGRAEAGLADAPRRRAAIAFAALILAAALLNQTRGALLGLGAGFAAVALLDARIRRWTRAVFLLALAAVGLWEFLLPTGRSLLAALQEHGSDGVYNQQMNRIVFWHIAWRAFTDHPMFGVGQGNYLNVFEGYWGDKVQGQYAWGSAHNLYLHQLAERGIAGILALAAVLGTLLKGAADRARAARDGWAFWAFSATVGFLVMNLTEVAFQNEQVTTLFLFVWALGDAGSGAAVKRVA